MVRTSKPLLIQKVWRFTRKVIRDFNHNQGILLAGSVAYNTLLSLIPLVAILMAVLSLFVDRERLLETVTLELERLVPGKSEAIVAELTGLLDQTELIGLFGIVLLLIFSSLAFRMLEAALGVIFHKAKKTHAKRGFWKSVGIHYAYVGLAGLALLVITGLSAMLGSMQTLGVLVYLSGLVAQIALFTSIFMVLPVARVKLKRALIGGLTCAVLWEATRYFLAWYFVNISLVGFIYGSLATVIVVLVSMEIACIILLLGAQVIAELERAAELDLPWYE